MKSSMRITLWIAAAAALAAPTARAAERTALPPLYTRWENFTVENGMPDDKVFCVAVDGDRVWAGTEDGLVLIQDGKVRRVYKPEDGLVHRVVMSLAVDKNTGDLWIGTFGGLSRLSGGVFTNYTNFNSGLLNDIIYGVGIQDEFVWIATTAGISRLNQRTGEWRNWSEFNAPFHEPWSYGVAPAPEVGKVWFAVWGGGMIEYDIAGDWMKAYTDPDEEMELVLFKNQGLIHIIVSNIAWNPDTKMTWGSTYFGLTGYDGRNWHNYLSKDSGLISDFINAPKSRGDEVWACTDKGLSYLNFKTNTWVSYRPNKENGHGEVIITWPDGTKTTLETPTTLAHNYILNMDFDGEDVWIATAKGLSHGIREPHKEGQLYESAKPGR